MFEKKKLLGVGITIATKKEILKYILTGLEKPVKKYYVVTPNPEILVLAKDQNYKKCLNGADLALPDGIGVILASMLLGKGLKGRITGVDLVDNLCKGVAEKPITVGFLGAGPGVAEEVAECLKRKYPGLKVSYASEEWSGGGVDEVARKDFRAHNAKKEILSNPASEPASAISKNFAHSPQFNLVNSQSSIINDIDILFVAFGSPKQEFWIAQNLQNLPAKVVIGVGGAFDFISGRIKRAPVWIQKLGFEWLFRLIIQPWRIKRQLSLIKFVYLVLRESFKI